MEAYEASWGFLWAGTATLTMVAVCLWVMTGDADKSTFFEAVVAETSWEWAGEAWGA